MKRIEIGEDRTVRIDGTVSDVDVETASAEDVTFPGVWLDGARQYDVELWRADSLVAAVPPASEEVDASYTEHERRRQARGVG